MPLFLTFNPNTKNIVTTGRLTWTMCYWSLLCNITYWSLLCNITLFTKGGGALVFQVGYHPRTKSFKTHPKHIFPGIKIDHKFTFLHVFFFLIFQHLVSKIYDCCQKHTLFSNFWCFCTPKWCMCVHCLVLENNSNYVFQGWYPPCLCSNTSAPSPGTNPIKFVTMHILFFSFSFFRVIDWAHEGETQKNIILR